MANQFAFFKAHNPFINLANLSNGRNRVANSKNTESVSPACFIERQKNQQRGEPPGQVYSDFNGIMAGRADIIDRSLDSQPRPNVRLSEVGRQPIPCDPYTKATSSSGVRLESIRSPSTGRGDSRLGF